MGLGRRGGIMTEELTHGDLNEPEGSTYFVLRFSVNPSPYLHKDLQLEDCGWVWSYLEPRCLQHVLSRHCML